MTHMFLSPHYDDAVYSCGGLIHKLVLQGEPVIIFTIMAGEPLGDYPETPVLLDNHKRWQAGDDPVSSRREEDQVAAEILGAQTLYNDLPECIYRLANDQALYPTEDSLWGQVQSDDPAAAQLRSLGIAFDGLEALYAPLAVGNHVDHQIVRDWALYLAKQHPDLTVKFYEDYPYMRVRSTVDKTLENFSYTMQPENHPLYPLNVEIKVQAMAAYVSQISSFWDTSEAIKDDVRRAFQDNQTGQIRERLWIPQRA